MATTLKERLCLAIAGPPKVSQAALAKACGVKAPSVNDWLSGQTKTIKGANLLNAARALNVNPDWLATGRGPRERFRTEELGESITSGLASTPSQSVTLDPHILVEAEKWVLFEEGPNRKYALALYPRAERLCALYALIAADGGTLSPTNAARLTEAVRARLQGDGDERREEDRDSRTASG